MIGIEGQKKLSAGSVLIIGCGALGSHVAMLLAGAGVGKIGIADFDIVGLSNLQRQLYFDEKSVGESKLEVLQSRMKGLNSEIKIVGYPFKIEKSVASDIISEYDFIVEATDDYRSKYYLSRICLELGKPLCIGGVEAWRGQVMSVRGVRKEDLQDEEDPRLGFEHIFPVPEDREEMGNGGNKQELGVLGIAPAIIASIQASEVIKFFTGEGEMLFGKLMVMDISKNFYQVLSL